MDLVGCRPLGSLNNSGSNGLCERTAEPNDPPSSSDSERTQQTAVCANGNQRNGHNYMATEPKNPHRGGPGAPVGTPVTLKAWSPWPRTPWSFNYTAHRRAGDA